MSIKRYKAKDGYVYQRIIDNFIMGKELYLNKFIDGTDDVIENYKEIIDSFKKDNITYEIPKNIKKIFNRF